MSRELILGMALSLDGFVAGPNGEIDWMFPTMSDAGREWVAEKMGQAGLIAMGQKSYHGMADFWPTAAMPMAAAMNETPKAVFSRSGKFAPPEMEKTKEAAKDNPQVEAALNSWLNPMVAGQNLVADIEKLKSEDGKPILVLGGASFAASLVRANLIDVYRLAIHPIAIGRGLPLFGSLETHLRFKMEDLKQFDTGTVAITYRTMR